MKVLVTGGTGFTGSALSFYLINKGYKVKILDNQKGLFYEELLKKGAEIIIGSVTNADDVKKSMEDVEGVFHLAAAFRKINLPNKVYLEVNRDGTKLLCEEALKKNVKKFVYCSTQGVHGDIKNPPGDENSPITPADFYQFSKYEGEKVVTEYAKKGLKSVIIRPTAIYGPGDPERFLHLFRLAKKGKFLMFGNGKTFYHPVYIDNLNDGFLKAFLSDKVNAEAYIIGDEKYYTIEELVLKVGESMGINVKIIHLPFAPLYIAACICEFLCKIINITPPLFRRRVDWFRQNRAFKIDKAKKEINYQPTVGLEEGLKKTAQWYKEKGYI